MGRVVRQGFALGLALVFGVALAGCGSSPSGASFTTSPDSGGAARKDSGLPAMNDASGPSDATLLGENAAPESGADASPDGQSGVDSSSNDSSIPGEGGLPESGVGEGGLTDGPLPEGAIMPGTYGCSGDLQSVVNGQGQVIQMCPPTEGCANGACVPACQAAATAQGTIGCDFVQATPSFYPGIKPPCWAVFLANNWDAPATVDVTYNGTSYNVSQFGRIAQSGVPEAMWATVPATGIPVGQVAVLFISSDPNSSNETPLTCPVADALNMGSDAVYTGVSAATGIGQAWEITTSVPVTGYDILPYGGASSFLPSAELLIPTTAWGTNYVSVVPYLGTVNGQGQLSPGPQWGQIVASQNNTMVQISPVVSLPSGTGVAAAPMGQTTTYTLSAGQFLQWQNSAEMSGSVITSNNPIGFNGGNGYICYKSMTSMGGGCDSAHQQIPPVSAAGSVYVAPPYTTRMASLAPESIPYRLVGMVAGTTLTYDPPVSGAPTTLSVGQVVDFESTLAFTVSSQDAMHPFYVGQMMSGCEVTDTGGSRPGVDPSGPNAFLNCLGDEEYVNILPPAQYLSKYIFFTDETYATTNLVFVRVAGATGFSDVTLDCAGTLTGWQPVGTAGKYEITNIDLVRATTPNGTCNNGPHTASSAGQFGLMVWGLDSYSSYAYPAGGNVTTINTVTVGH